MGDGLKVREEILRVVPFDPLRLAEAHRFTASRDQEEVPRLKLKHDIDTAQLRSGARQRREALLAAKDLETNHFARL